MSVAFIKDGVPLFSKKIMSFRGVLRKITERPTSASSNRCFRPQKCIYFLRGDRTPSSMG